MVVGALRKLVLVICMFLSVILFINGILVLSDNEDEGETKYYGKKNDYKEKKLNREENNDECEPINLLIIGLDDEEVRSDVIMLLNYSPALGRINILSVARDTRVRVRGRIEKINALVGMGGEELVIKAMEQITSLPVKYYITLNFEGFRKIIDTLGGVEVNVPIDMVYDDPTQDLHINLKKGRQLLDGEKAEQFVRYRKGNNPDEGYIDGDIGRNRAQQQLIRELIDQKIKFRYLSKADEIYNILRRYMKTNIKFSDVAYYLKYLPRLDYNKVRTFTAPGYSKQINGVWYFICDQDETLELVNKYFFK